MTTLDILRSRLAGSAKLAADAAKKLSLDDMAKNDKYIHSVGLRVSDRKKKVLSSSKSNESPSVVEDLSGIVVNDLSMAARKHNRPTIAKHQRSPRVEATRNQVSTATHQHPMSQMQKPSVAAVYNLNEGRNIFKQSVFKDGSDGQDSTLTERKTRRNGHSEVRGIGLAASLANSSPESPGLRTKSILLVNELQAHILTDLNYDSDTDSSDDSLSPVKSKIDIEMGKLGNSALHDQLEHELEDSISRQLSLNGPANADKGKGVHRFMEMTTRLETEREMLIKSERTARESTQNHADKINERESTAGEETNNALKAGLAWVRNVAAPRLETVSKHLLTKVSEPELRNKSTPHRTSQDPNIGPRYPVRHDSSDDIITSTSTAVLSVNDMAELERIRERSSTSKLQALLQTCIDNQRFLFVGVTLVVALFAYFYSRHRSVNDVL